MSKELFFNEIFKKCNEICRVEYLIDTMISQKVSYLDTGKTHFIIIF